MRDVQLDLKGDKMHVAVYHLLITSPAKGKATSEGFLLIVILKPHPEMDDLWHYIIMGWEEIAPQKKYNS